MSASPSGPPHKRSKISPGTWVVRNVRENSFNPDQHLAASGPIVGQALRRMLDGTGLPQGETKYSISRRVESTVRLGGSYPLELYQQVKARCQDCARDILKDQLLSSQQLKSRDAIEFARLLLRTWQSWLMRLQTIREVFSFLDQAYCKRSPQRGVSDIIQTGADIFRSTIGLNTEIQAIATRGVLAAFDHTHDSDPNHVDTASQPEMQLATQYITMCQYLKIYHPYVEEAYLEDLKMRYVFVREEVVQEKSRIHSSAFVQALLRSETRRAEIIGLEAETITKALDLMTVALVNNLTLYWTEPVTFHALVENGDVEVLARIYHLFSRNGLQDQLTGPWGEACLTAGRAILDKPQEGVVQRLLQLKIVLDCALSQGFSNRQTFEVKMRESFETFMNERRAGEAWSTNNSKIAEMIAKYVDRLLRDGSKAITIRGGLPPAAVPATDDQNELHSDDQDLERALDLGLDLFRFVRGKDVFEAFYKKDLAKRLLLNRSASDAAERYMMTVLRKECGEAFTHNLEEMFKDIELAKETNAGFRHWESQGAAGVNAPDLAVQVLSASAWPTYNELSLTLPSSISRQVQSFDEYYRSKHKARKVTWRHLMSHAIIRANFGGVIKELQVSALQAVVLLQFEDLGDDEVLTYSELASGTQLEGAQLTRTLQSLACGKLKVLRKSSKGAEIKESDKFVVNHEFDHPNYRIKINQIQLRETEQENKETHERVAADRQFEIQAAIVRIMKSKQSVTHNELVTDIIKALSGRGSIEIYEIKANIEKLIEKEYIEREDAKYKYIT